VDTIYPVISDRWVELQIIFTPNGKTFPSLNSSSRICDEQFDNIPEKIFLFQDIQACHLYVGDGIPVDVNSHQPDRHGVQEVKDLPQRCTSWSYMLQ
jgi:hypothetical protein